MCWTCNLKDLKPLIADKDIEVYKIVKHANEKFCVSVYQNYCYAVGFVRSRTLNIEIQGCYANIRIGLHSYKSVTFVPDSIHIVSGVSWKSIYYSSKLNEDNILVDNDLYLATFKIPQNSVYFKNNLGEIVSNSIYYTGKYLKL